jgi:hypothetical protein
MCLELWKSTKCTNLNRIQSLQSKILRKVVDAPFYVTNLTKTTTIHNDLKVPFVHGLVRIRYKKFLESTIHHPNPLALYLSSNTLLLNPTRHLKRCWPRDLEVQWKANKLKWWVVPIGSLLNIGPSDYLRTQSHLTITVVKLIFYN